VKLDRRQFLATSAAAGLAARGRPAGAQTPSAADPLGVRDDFPAAAKGAYLNTPYIGPVPEAVARAGVEFDRAKAESPIALGDMLAETEAARVKLAKLFGADDAEIGFLSATSAGENLVTRALDLGPGDNVVVDDLHYTTTYLLYKTLETTRGLEVRVARSVSGRADVESFEPLVDARTRLVSVSWVSHQNGYRHDLRELAALAHGRGALLYADGIQGLGMFPVDLHEEGVDFLTSGTYKWLHASFGVAPFYIRAEHLDRFPPDRLGWHSAEHEGPGDTFELHRTARKYEYATLAFGPVYQLSAALDYLESVGLARIEAHVVGLGARMRRGLVDLGFRTLTPEDNASSIVAFAHGKSPEDAQALFDRERVRVSFREEGTQIRAGAAMFNNEADIDRLLDVAERLARL
jgi:selenocysteine lyase/cysteine desulfurase